VIRLYPDPVLRGTAEPIAVIDEEVRRLAEDMIETMYAARGVGLAAPQVGVLKRLVTIDVSGDQSEPLVLVNPEIEESSGRQAGEEGCLSLPGLTGDVVRPEHAVLVAQGLDGAEIRLEGDELPARAFHHELDHLDGILFIDKLSKVERFRLRDEIRRLEADFARRVGA
jgi:peptide deformylase